MSAVSKTLSAGSLHLQREEAVLALVIAIIGTSEGVRTVADRDVVSIQTVYFGKTRGAEMGDRYTLDDFRTMLGEGVRHFKVGTRASLTDPWGILETPYASILSATYNIGTSGSCASFMTSRLRVSDIRGACDALFLGTRRAGAS